MPKLAEAFEMRTILKHPITILVLLNLIIFHKYWLGISTPPWDFLGGGMVEQYRFYKDGGFFNPPSWFPYAWFGIPEYQMLQDGGWFIPVAVVSNLFGWHPANAARLQAFLVLFGTVGTYYLSRIFISKKWINLLAAVMYSFIPAFYSNAQHYGVVRSAALLPWILLFIHPKTLQKSRISIFIGSLLIFQSITGSYPGNLISTFYTVLLFILFISLGEVGFNSRYYLRLMLMGLLGSLMGALRYLPVIQLQNSFPKNVGNQAGITFYNLKYLIYPYVGENLPWEDPTLRSIFIGSVALCAMLFINFKAKYFKSWFLLTLISIFLMSQNEFNVVIRENIPLLNVSRFAITDWRNTFNISVIMLTGITLNNLKPLGKYRKIFLIITFFVLISFLTFLGHEVNFSILQIFYVLLVLTLTFFTIFKLTDTSISNNMYSKILVALAAVTGIIFIFQNSFSWSTTVKEQNFNIYNNTFTNVQESIKYPLKYRTSRIILRTPPLAPEDYKNDQRYNRFWLTGNFGALGYHNVKDIPAYAALFPRLESQNDPLIKFLLSRSKQLIVISESNTNDLLNQCNLEIFCNNAYGVRIFQNYFDKGSESFSIDAPINFTLIQNEMFSPVWHGKICKQDNCKNISSKPFMDSLRSWELPAGQYELITEAKTPLNNLRWVMFYFGLIISALTIYIKPVKMEID
jgi:hypothetical protein